jgi:putative transferase (TIGR04331 family)
MWVNKYNKNIILKKKSNKGTIFQDFKIVVIDNFSTPLFELLYKSYPFIIINDSNLSEYKNEFKSIVKNLEKLGILFTSEKRAAQFLNFNYQNIESWWKKITEKKQFIQIKKKLFPIKKFDQLKLIDILKK